MVHRDVKPDNILITRDGVAKLADLGLVKELDTDLNLTRTGRGLGTPHFMAPEQFRNAKSVDNRSDVYSLAATLYMMVTGELPFKQLAPVEAWTQKVENKLKSARELVPDLSERLDFAIRRAMRADPAQRPATVREFIEDLTGHSTRPLSPSASNSGQDIWYLRFKDDDGVLHTAKDTLVSVRRSLKEGLFGDTNNIRASRNPDGPFELLRKLPEFRDVIIAAAIASHKPAPRRTAPPAAPRPVAPPAPVPHQAVPPAVARPQPPMPQPVATPAPVRPPSATLGIRPPSAHLGRSGHPIPIDPAVPPVAPAEPEPYFAPHIDLGTPSSTIDWGRAILFLLLAIIAGAAGFFLLPQLLR
jgi:serine/threonine protein kinase